MPLGSGSRVADSGGSAPSSGSGEPAGAAAPETKSGRGSPQAKPAPQAQSLTDSPSSPSPGLVQRCVIIQKDQHGFGFTVSGDRVVLVQSVRPGERGRCWRQAAAAGRARAGEAGDASGLPSPAQSHIPCEKTWEEGVFLPKRCRVGVSLQHRPGWAGQDCWGEGRWFWGKCFGEAPRNHRALPAPCPTRGAADGGWVGNSLL